jgi:hypothetical protein
MRKLNALISAILSALLFSAAILGLIASVLGILPKEAILAALPSWSIPHSGQLLFLENILLIAGLLSAFVAIYLWCGLNLRGIATFVRSTAHWECLVDCAVATLGFLDARAKPVHFAAISLILAGSSLILQGWVAHPELRVYMPHYLSQRPALELVYDFRYTEVPSSIYVPRHLSYFVDMMDARFIGFSFRQAVPHFISASYYIFWGLICWLLWSFFTTQLALDPFTSGLLILLIQTSPVMFLGGTYFRSAKPGMTVCVVAAVCIIYRLLKAPEELTRCRRTMAASAAALFFASSLFDITGAYFTFLAALHAGLEWFNGTTPKRKAAASVICLALICSFAVFLTYDYFLAPTISHTVIGERPNPSFQNNTVKELLRASLTGSVQSILLFVDVCRFFLGNLSLPVTAILIVYLGSLLVSCVGKLAHPQESARLSRNTALHCAMAGAMLCVLTLLLVSRHQPMLWIDVRRSVYGLPLTSFCCLFVGIGVSYVFRAQRYQRTTVQAVLAVLLAGNLLALPEHTKILRSGHLASWITRTAEIKGQFRKASRLVSVPEEVRSDPLYQALRTFVDKAETGAEVSRPAVPVDAQLLNRHSHD